jgi:hypothetical protein
MRATFRLAGVALVTVAAGCSKEKPPQEQNIVIADSNMAGADIEALPSDESSGTPSGQLVNGNDNPDVNDTTANGD